MRVVPFNDLAAARQAFEEHQSEVAGMIVEPAMMNCGVILPEPGYLQGLADLCHEFGAYLAFDEVKTGATLAYGGAVEAFGVVPDIVCLAKAIGGGIPCGAIGATEELFALVVGGEYDMAGTFNGNPLTMAATRATLTEVLTQTRTSTLNRLHGLLVRALVGDRALPAARVRHGPRREGLGDLLPTPVREYRDALGIDERITYLAWLFQQNGGVFKSPWSKQETWTLSVAHTDEDAQRYVDNFEAFARAVTT